MNYNEIFSKAEEILSTNGTKGITEVCELLMNEIEYYNWVGFYFMNDETQILEIGPYAGAETEHTRIPYGKGICGQVAVSGETFKVDDVYAQDNYIACSIETKAELVVPMKRNGSVIGQIDIDSHHATPFTDEDEVLLSQICDLVAALDLSPFGH
ncbi:GAF domain-containing protein [Phaeocystidibacter luteus]|uniref:GAF domain-containing protein n=1 Tax=Phaeocystidibacter luteus TaxID=911197 RepID=A0A6N6RKQ0_9FLAO|nr:GAF domain-containing protein [Phaeocystidibacter luteus]KAB2808150.1 GAF domain-containing protein [Phaeocystidibacter luteus]